MHRLVKFIMLTLLALIVIGVLCLSELSGSSNQNVVSSTVTIDIPNQGTIRGDYDTTSWSQQTFMSFRGIPFAESPSGSLRYKLTSVMPVMFYIYGGGFYNGSNIDHPPQYLLEKDIVLVVPNYRVGALGWLSTLDENMPGNAPIGDLLLALQWVQDYVHLFGGDRKQVTIFGQSAGAVMSSALLFSPHTPSEYFHRSIIQSGSIFATWATNSEPLEQVQRICFALECDKCLNKNEINHCLKNVKVPKLLEVTQKESFSPVISDFYGILPKDPERLFNDFNKSVPLMTGFTKHDGSFILANHYDSIKLTKNLTTLTVRNFIKEMIDATKDGSGLSNNLLTKLLFTKDLLDSSDHKRATPAYFDLASIVSMKSPVLTLAKNMLNKNLAPVYLYSFDYEGSNTRFGYEFGNEHYPFDGGVHHSNDNIYLFSTHSLNTDDKKMAIRMVDIWTSFAVEGKPKLNDETESIPMKSDSGPYFHINSQITLGEDVYEELTITIDDPNKERCM